ncbi:MAG: flippase-like domain-containing protein [Lachnospiraceae bacterium]|nr:flippase-like domain-containing protein [Lachnospiraceae bacterium]
MSIMNQESRKKKSRKWIGRGVLLILLMLSLLFYRDTLWNILEGIRRVTWGELVGSICLAFFGYSLDGLTISIMMRAVGSKAKAREGIFIAFVCEFYRLTTLGNGSGIAEIHYLHEKGVELGSATVLTMIQFALKRTAVMLLGLTGFVYLCHKEVTKVLCSEYRVFVGIGCLIAVIVIFFYLCLVLYSKVANALVWVLDCLAVRIKTQEKNFEKWKEQIRLLNRSGRCILGQKRKMLCVVFLQIGKLMTFYMIPAFLLRGKIDLAVGECVLVMAVAFMLAGVIPTPSGVGALEFVFVLFFTSFTDSGTAVPAILLFRFVTWICPAIVGGVLLL